MNKIVLGIITTAIIVSIGIIFFGQSRNNLNSDLAQSKENVEVRDGIQYVTIIAKGGYSPRISNAKSDIRTKLIIKTNGTYDCSASLVIRSIGYQKILPQTGEEIIDLGIPKSGTLQGLCGMGMYNFSINFR